MPWRKLGAELVLTIYRKTRGVYTGIFPCCTALSERSCAFRFYTRRDDCLCGAEYCGNPKTIVCCARTQIPRIEMSPNDEHLLGMLGSKDLSHYILRFHRRTRELVLNVEAQAHWAVAVSKKDHRAE